MLVSAINEPWVEAFTEACGASGPLQVEVEDLNRKGNGYRVIHQPFAVIGRDKDGDVLLDDPQISNHHAYLQVIAGRLFVVDLHSRTGIHWPTGSSSHGWLGRNQAIYLGPFTLRLRDGTPSGKNAPSFDDSIDNPLASASGEAVSYPNVTLEFLNLVNKQPPWRMRPIMALAGRSPSCKVRLHDDRVSRVHCAFLRTPTGLWAVDLRGQGGIRVNGAPVRCARLNDGDVLLVGRYKICARYDTPAVAATPAESRAAARTAIHKAALTQVALPPDSADAALPPAVSPLPLAPAAPKILAVGSAALPAQAPADGALAALLAQFGQMQQQMFDQFQQALMMMVQMFNSLHREQLGLVREELDRLQGLTTELQTLQTELAKQTVSRPARQPAPSAPAEGSPLVSPSPRPAESAARAPRNTANGGAPEPAPLPRPVNVAIPPEIAQNPEKISAWLYQRIEEIQSERQSGWKRVLNLVRGQ